MNHKLLHAFAVLIAVLVAATGAQAVVDTPADALPGEVGSGGLHLVASVDSNLVVPAVGDVASVVPFAHSARASGDYSVLFDGASSLRSGEIVAGYLIGCAVDLSNGVSVGIAPAIGINGSITPSIAITLTPNSPPSLTLGSAITLGGNAELAGELAVTLAPGTVTAAAIGAAALDKEATFPYTFAHTNTPLNVSGCLFPASAMPFVTVRADGTSGSVQTTGYGPIFTF